MKMDLLNQRAGKLVDGAVAAAEELQIAVQQMPDGGRSIDFGCEVEGTVDAGILLARICMADLAEVTLLDAAFHGMIDSDEVTDSDTEKNGDSNGYSFVQVATESPVESCLCSQYAGWQIAVDDFFAMGSGPMRAVAGREPLFEKLNYRDTAESVIGVLETKTIPDAAVFQMIAEKTGIAVNDVTLLSAAITSHAGNLQVVARSLETALHKLLELDFDMHRIQKGTGVAPLPPLAKDTLGGIARTNDAILYGGDVTLWITGDDLSLAKIGPRVPTESSAGFGKSFREIFEEADRDFYKIDPHFFSPARIVFHNVDTGSRFEFGKLLPDVWQRSFCE